MKKKKLIPKRRFKEFIYDEAWEQRKLEDVASKIGDGLHGTPEYSEKENIFFINGNNLVDGKVVITDDTKKVAEVERSPDDKGLDKNTILMSINGTIGNLALYNGERLMLGKSVSYIMTKKSDRKFIFYTLQTKAIRDYFFDSLTGSTIKNLGLKAIKDTNVLIPNRKEQIQISTFFSNLDNLITLHQRKLKKLKEIKSAYLSEMFPKEGEKYPKRRFEGFTDPWKERKLGELDFTISDGNYGELYPKANELLSEGIPFIRVNNLKNGYLVHKDLVYISTKQHSILKSGHLKKYDILITTRGEIGKIALVDDSFENANINAQICLIRTENKMESKYLHQYMQTNFCQKEISSFQTGSALKQLPKKRLEDINVVYPILKEEQKKIGMFFTNLDNLITLHQHKLEKLENLKKAYLNEMFV